jgi:hypothetical protein
MIGVWVSMPQYVMTLKLNDVTSFAEFDTLLKERAYLINTGADDHFLLKTGVGYLVAFHVAFYLTEFPSVGPSDAICQTLETALLHLLRHASTELIPEQRAALAAVKTFQEFDEMLDIHNYHLHVVTEQHWLSKESQQYEVTWRETITEESGQEVYSSFEQALIAFLRNVGYEQEDDVARSVEKKVQHLLQQLEVSSE